MDFPISQLKIELEKFRAEISQKIKDLAELAGKLSEEEMSEKVEDIKNLQSIIQYKTNQYFNKISEQSQKSSYTPEQVAELTKRIKENLK